MPLPAPELLARLAPYAADGVDLAQALARVAIVPGAQWRPEWTHVLFDGLPDDLRSELLDALEPRDAGIVPDTTRLAALRDSFGAFEIDAFIVPQRNEHGTRDMPACVRRLEWLTGFTGSAGTAVIAADAAWLFVDGRYELQAETQLADTGITPRHFLKPPMWEYLAETLPRGTRLGFDPRLHPEAALETARKTLDAAGIALQPVTPNPIDALWRPQDRPPRPFAAVVPHPLDRAGTASQDKRAQIARTLTDKGIDAYVLTELESVAWTLNIRGGDAEHTPVPESYAILGADGAAELFIERRKLTQAAVDHLGNSVTVSDYDGFEDALTRLAGTGATTGIDRARASHRVVELLSGGGKDPVHLDDPTMSLRETKNDAELAGLREALARDGAAVVKFLRWLTLQRLDALPDEYTLAQRITAFRAEDPAFRGTSFSPIVGFGPNGAVIHYSPPERGSRTLAPDDVILVDSGGQYLTGTTDITRTLCLGSPAPYAVKVSTAVLRGHIALATTRFPIGATGAQLDGIARAPLWRIGLDYDHGTGHGIGSCLSVHEGTIQISKTCSKPVSARNVLSNEPGAYLRGRFGIRHENTMVAQAAEGGDADLPFLEFETLTAAPFDRSLIDHDALSARDRAWLNAYHAYVRRTAEPYLQGADMDWLIDVTADI